MYPRKPRGPQHILNELCVLYVLPIQIFDNIALWKMCLEWRFRKGRKGNLTVANPVLGEKGGHTKQKSCLIEEYSLRS